MTCDLCGEKEATVHFTEIIDDQTRELHLCEACAQEKGALSAQHFGLADLLAGLADFGTKLEGAPPPKTKCPGCGMTYEDFRKSGRLGCGRCYEAFRQSLAPLLKRIHGSTQHMGKAPPEEAAPVKGKVPKESEDLAALKERLRQAVAQEAFEEAARLRDRIRAMESRKKSKGSSSG